MAIDKRKSVLVFGVFDGLHEGHIAFLRQAAEHGKVIAVVALDDIVQELKHKKPQHDEISRREAVSHCKYVHEAVLGDSVLGTYSAIRTYKPKVICIGHDQDVLEEHLTQWITENNVKIKLVRARKFEF